MTVGTVGTVGLVGLGVMGSAMAAALSAAGVELRVYDVRADVALPPGARRCPTAAEAASNCDVVLVSVPGPPEVRAAVLSAETGALWGMRAHAVLVDTTTSSLAVCQEVAASCADRGVGFLDAPVTGRPPKMTMLVGGDDAVLTSARPVLELIAAEVCHLGGSGAGCVAKLVNQLLIYGNFLTMCEGLALAAKADVGLDLPAAVAAWRTGGADSASLARLAGPVLRGSYADARGAPLDLVAKDMGLLASFAADLGVPSAVATRLSEVFTAAQSQGFGQEYFAAVAKVIEASAGVQFGS